MFQAIAADGSTINFTGELVAQVSAELPEKDRWTEFSLYLTDFNTWILQGVGKSRVKGEKDRYWYVVSSDPMDWLDKILSDDPLSFKCEDCGHVTKSPYGMRVSRLSKKLLKDAFNYLKDCEEE